MRQAGHAALVGENGSAHNLFLGKPEGKRLIGRYTCRWEQNIKT
jgi:hypothetical protein